MKSPIPSRLSALLLVLPAIAACSTPTSSAIDQGSKQQSEDTGSTEPTVPFGGACTKNSECALGLLCMQSDFSTSGWCTMWCDNPKDYCDADELGGAKALCLKMPDNFKGPSKAFCALRCDNTPQCNKVWSGWETCAKPAYKNINLYNDLPTKVCMAPASHGRIQIDPIRCDWEDKATRSHFQGPKQVCKAYCTYLTKCKFFDPNKEHIDCCTWRCFQRMTPGGKVDDGVEDEIKCYTTAFFQAYANTPEVCSGPTKDCGEPRDPHKR